MGRVRGSALLPSLGVHIENLSEDLKPSQHFAFWQQNSDYCSGNLDFPSPGCREGVEVVGDVLDVTKAPWGRVFWGPSGKKFCSWS